MTQLTPQEKKRLSYARERRNSYGENSKSSRKAIPLRKRIVNRLNRRAVAIPLRQPAETVEQLEVVDNEAKARRRHRWQKSPDIPLSEHLRRQAARQQIRRHRKAGRRAVD
ncbi:hypothetical protein [Planctomyces sp. SH-PL14]|uniref:hypothetical protein n=1 Tax=Planctomyces sp. SH-PL14 TaxID=1632864 RepID=UPI00078B1AE9|nr:hypothetical protein [Planctomyces sp. SH-PL14]AMV18746.1 hypothetical protein VT03_12685 [Planctomyces sp. SH-PL14]